MYMLRMAVAPGRHDLWVVGCKQCPYMGSGLQAVPVLRIRAPETAAADRRAPALAPLGCAPGGGPTPSSA